MAKPRIYNVTLHLVIKGMHASNPGQAEALAGSYLQSLPRKFDVVSATARRVPLQKDAESTLTAESAAIESPVVNPFPLH